MPQFSYTGALVANAKGRDFLTGWQYRYLPFRAHVKIIDNCTAAAGTVTRSVFSGSETIVQSSPVQVGGTAGVMPAELNNSPIEWVGAAGDLILVLYDEGAGATPTVNGTIFVNPV